ncbi:NAD(P)-dependent oxidoreductase [Stenotrophomonas indicatrix]
MKVALFGATGRTGQYLIEEGLTRSMDLTVFARSSTEFEDLRVRVVRGDLTDITALRSAISGADAVLSALGPTSLQHPKDLPITHATEAIISAMKLEGVKRLVAISTGTAVDPADGSDWKISLPAEVIKLLMKSSYQDIIGLARAIRASDLYWTMVRVGFLNGRPAAPRLIVGMYGRTKHAMGTSRADTAKFMFDQITHPEFIGQAPGISSAKG